MAGTAYHMEALRKSRVIERKTEAMKKMQESVGQSGAAYNTGYEPPNDLVFSEQGHYAQNRLNKKAKRISNDEVVFEEVVHDPNFKYRILKDSGNTPMHVDPIYKIMYPGGLRKLTYYRTGTVRDMRQYDHSREGPVVDKSRYQLKREFNFLGSSLGMLKNDIVAVRKPIPVCRRY